MKARLIGGPLAWDGKLVDVAPEAIALHAKNPDAALERAVDTHGDPEWCHARWRATGETETTPVRHGAKIVNATVALMEFVGYRTVPHDRELWAVGRREDVQLSLV